MRFWKKIPKKSKRELFMRFAAVLLSGVIFEVVAFFSFAWFADHTKVNGTGMQVTVSSLNYELSCLENGSNGVYYDDYHSLVRDTGSIVWQMTAENNMYNHESSISELEDYTEEGIYPGAYGVISFYVKPLVDSLYLDFQFEILGYSAEEDEDTGDITMTQLDSDFAPAEYLNGHIMLFENRTGDKNNHVYSNPILTNEDMKRVISEKHFTENGTKTRIDIYWIWPVTLSSIVDARSSTVVNVTQEPLVNTTTEDYTNIVNNVRTYPEYYFSLGDNSGIDPSSITESQIAQKYDIYGLSYDLADNEIGDGVRYVLLKMKVIELDESTISSGGSGSGG